MNEIRVLLIDDQAIVAEALRQDLAGERDVIFHFCSDPTLVEEEIKKFSPSVILQDLILPGTTGIKIIEDLRKKVEYSDIPIILLSTNDNSETKYQAFMAGANDYVVKFPERFELLGRLRYHSRSYMNGQKKAKAERMLAQRSRLESLGNLSAGIAHEINTPLQYVASNINFFTSTFESIEKLLQALAPYLEEEKIAQLVKEIDLPYLREEIPTALTQTADGIRQITTIVRAMKVFSHPGNEEKSQVDLKALIEDILTVSRNEWKDVATIATCLPDTTLAVMGFQSGLSQVLLNLVVNAAQAIAERIKNCGTPGRIEISAIKREAEVVIQVSDNGGGIPSHIRERIFDPFFTTKEVGKGSGQGLSIARSIITDAHGGTIDVTVEEGIGTTFSIHLPIK